MDSSYMVIASASWIRSKWGGPMIDRGVINQQV